MTEETSKETLRVEDLRVYYTSVLGEYKVVDGVDLSIHKDEVFGIAGESGCGKSTLVEGILRLVVPPGYIKSGRVFFNGVNLLPLEEEAFRKMRFKELAYVPQGSMNSLNPVMRVGHLMIETIIAEAILPVVVTGFFGYLSGADFLAMIQRKAEWIEKHREVLTKLIES